jgi:NAD(P)-dependent dehydrogenase (short-subunit alcohol dehydrogenase family)
MRARNISEEQALAEAVSRIGLGRLAKPEDVAEAVLFLASEKASYISGVTIAMDGVTTPVI